MGENSIGSRNAPALLSCTLHTIIGSPFLLLRIFGTRIPLSLELSISFIPTPSRAFFPSALAPSPEPPIGREYYLRVSCQRYERGALLSFASRLFHSACNEAGHNFAQYAADYTLFQIGEYDEKTGMIKMDDTFANLGNGASFVNATSLSLVGKPEELPRQMKEEFPISPEEERAIIGDNDNG